MIFTWDTTNLCIVFDWWHIKTTPGLILSLIIVIALGVGYEALRELSRRYENAVNQRLESAPSKYLILLLSDYTSQPLEHLCLNSSSSNEGLMLMAPITGNSRTPSSSFFFLFVKNIDAIAQGTCL